MVFAAPQRYFVKQNLWHQHFKDFYRNHFSTAQKLFLKIIGNKTHQLHLWFFTKLQQFTNRELLLNVPFKRNNWSNPETGTKKQYISLAAKFFIIQPIPSQCSCLIPMKTSEKVVFDLPVNLWFSDVFRRIELEFLSYF